MSGREKRSVAQPMDYKRYNETGTQNDEGEIGSDMGQPITASHQSEVVTHPSHSAKTGTADTESNLEQDVVNLFPDVNDSEFADTASPRASKRSGRPEMKSNEKNKQNGARPKVKKVTRERDLSLPPPITDKINNLNMAPNLQDKHERNKKNTIPEAKTSGNKKAIPKDREEERYAQYYNISESDNEPDLALMYDKHVQIQHDKKVALDLARLDSQRNLTPDETDYMNEYYLEHLSKVPPPLPHVNIPRKKKLSKAERQQQLIDELANSDELIYCRETGMAKKKQKDSPARSTGKKASPKRDKRRVVKKDDAPKRRTHAKTAAARRSRSPTRKQRGYDRAEPWDRRRGRDRSSSSSGESESTSSDDPDDSNVDDSNSQDTSDTDESGDMSRHSSASSRHRHRRRNKKEKRVKSGILAKPSSKVKQELVYPHFSLCQGGSFVATEVTFNQLTYEQFLAGETHTILRCRNKKERAGRQRLLATITRWRLRTSVAWSQIRAAYAVILRDIENGIATWEENFYAYQHILYERPQLPVKTTKTVNNKAENYWFCKAYQKVNGCSLDPPHVARIGNRDRVVQHYCAKCYINNKQKKFHSESSLECPLYEH